MNASPAGAQILYVSNLQELVDTPFHENINAICCSRTLTGDFAEIINAIEPGENIATIEPAQLYALQLSEQAQLARDILLHDLEFLKAYDALPVLNIIQRYDTDDAVPFFPTDVYSFHVDRSPIPTATFLCTYHGASSDILPNAQATQKILIPEIRETLKKLYDDAEEGFETFLQEHYFDLHYQAHADAHPINLGIGNIWKLAVDHPESKVLPCIHRAPKERNGEKRLLLIC
jgi:hypothetical protein